jgi:hypothetical protein
MRIDFPFILKSFWFGNVLSAPRFPKFSSRTSDHETKAAFVLSFGAKTFVVGSGAERESFA